MEFVIQYLRFLACVFPLILGISSCHAPASTYPSLSNSGILPLSTSNPYLGANLFLSEELERSLYLYNFFKVRGAPIAIEIIDKRFNPTRMLLFFPRDKEAYIADLQQSKTAREWIVRGPFAIQRKDYRELARMEAAMAGEPVFVLAGEEHRFRFQREANVVTRIVTPILPPSPVPTPVPKPKRAPPKRDPQPTISAAPEPRNFRPMNSDQLAIYMSQGFAERTSDGDVIHTVTGNGETLSKISKWYAGSVEQQQRLAEINNLPPTAEITAGARVRIPLEIVKQFKAMPEGYE